MVYRCPGVKRIFAAVFIVNERLYGRYPKESVSRSVCLITIGRERSSYADPITPAINTAPRVSSKREKVGNGSAMMSDSVLGWRSRDRCSPHLLVLYKRDESGDGQETPEPYSTSITRIPEPRIHRVHQGKRV